MMFETQVTEQTSRPSVFIPLDRKCLSLRKVRSWARYVLGISLGAAGYSGDKSEKLMD